MKNAIRLFRLKRKKKLVEAGQSKIQAWLALSSGIIK